jgi:hypothetical protein
MGKSADCTTLRKLNLASWHKIRWKSGKNEGKADLMRSDILERYKSGVEVLETVQAESCARGIRLGWGITEEKEIDAWIKANKVK